MDIAKQRLLMNSLFTSKFNSCPLMWMFHSRGLNNKINYLNERCLRILYSNNISFFVHLLDRDKDFNSCKNFQTLVLEMFKVAKNFSASIVSEICEKRNNVCDLQNPFEFVLPKDHSVFHGTESISYLVPQIWSMVPLEMKTLTTINAFNPNKARLFEGSFFCGGKFNLSPFIFHEELI